MKKSIYILISLGLFIASCSKMLDIEPTDAISSEEAISDEQGVIKAISGAYYSLHDVGNYGRNRILIEDLAADNLKWTGTTREYQQFDQDQVASDNATNDGLWASNYDCINRVNNVLSRINGIEMPAQNRNTHTGDALFLRALSHFNLLLYYGGIPIKTKPTSDLSSINQARNSVQEVYAQVISDLLQAKNLLPANRAAGWASSFSASALLARVYLSQFQATNDLAIAGKAIDEATHVISVGGFSLAPSYGDLFEGNSSEVIFEVIFDAQNYNRLAQYFLPVSLTGRYEVGPDTAFVNNFLQTDTVRFNASIALDTTGLAYGYKYRDLSGGTDRVMVLRLAEMYLIRAEARAWSGGSVEDITPDVNQIRARAGLLPTTAASIPELKAAILEERRHEFAFEGQRWSDLVRTRQATTVLGIDENHTLFPIPLSELQTNKLMTQNPGY